MPEPETARRLAWAAYEAGWRAACDDHMNQERDREWPIGQRKHGHLRDLLWELDPNNLLGLLPDAPARDDQAGEERGDG